MINLWTYFWGTLWLILQFQQLPCVLWNISILLHFSFNIRIGKEILWAPHVKFWRFNSLNTPVKNIFNVYHISLWFTIMKLKSRKSPKNFHKIQILATVLEFSIFWALPKGPFCAYKISDLNSTWQCCKKIHRQGHTCEQLYKTDSWSRSAILGELLVYVTSNTFFGWKSHETNTSGISRRFSI